MPEQNQELGFDLRSNLKRKLTDLRILTVQPAIREAKYKAKVPPEKHEQQSKLAETFLGEAMAFLHEHTATKLSSVRPTEDQLQNMYYLFEAIEQGRLILTKTKGGVRPHLDQPYITKIYEAKDLPTERDDSLSRALRMITGGGGARNVRVLLNWDVDRQFPSGFPMSFRIYGNVGITSVEPINFLVLPEKAESPAQVEAEIGGLVHTDEEKTTIGVYGKGNRIVFNTEGQHRGKDEYITDQYYLIGSFAGEKTGKTYWIYGGNEAKHSKMTVNQRVGVGEPVRQTADINR